MAIFKFYIKVAISLPHSEILQGVKNVKYFWIWHNLTIFRWLQKQVHSSPKKSLISGKIFKKFMLFLKRDTWKFERRNVEIFEGNSAVIARLLFLFLVMEIGHMLTHVVRLLNFKNHRSVHETLTCLSGGHVWICFNFP